MPTPSLAASFILSLQCIYRNITRLHLCLSLFLLLIPLLMIQPVIRLRRPSLTAILPLATEFCILSVLLLYVFFPPTNITSASYASSIHSVFKFKGCGEHRGAFKDAAFETVDTCQVLLIVKETLRISIMKRRPPVSQGRRGIQRRFITYHTPPQPSH